MFVKIKMVKSYHIFLLIFALAFVLKPSVSNACGEKVEKTIKSCCKKEKDKQMDSCKNHHSNKSDDEPTGNCENTSCSCPLTLFAITPPFLIETKEGIFRDGSRKVKSYFNETYFSSGFVFIWSPPNIS